MKKDSLDTYRRKRDFEKTLEPSGDERTRRSPEQHETLSYLVHRHHASHLHFDLRLELDGVLKSWAVPKGPSLSPTEKRLAVQVEDHPFSYGTFEGAIPHGEYGGGYVTIWDKGVWEAEGDPHEGLKKGRLKLTFKGERLQGAYSLFRLGGKGRGDRKNWLLVKRDDAFARKGAAAEIAKPARVPALDEFSPQLAKLERALPDAHTGGTWGYEIKLDGYRALASVEGKKKCRFVSRNHKDWTDRFAEIGDALKELDVENAVFDGEVCVVDEQGRTRFQALQSALSEGTKGVLVYFVFDLLFIDGTDLRDRPLSVRKAILASILEGKPLPLAYVSHLESAKEAKEVLREACKRGLEGLVAKRLDRPHFPGRSPEWQKVKCTNEQEFAIVGYTKPKGSRSGLGALLLGAKEGKTLRYCGKVGTGFSDDLLRRLSKRLATHEVRSAAEAGVTGAPRVSDATWVEPSLVCQVAFTERTRDGSLRHPAFVGLREDKEPGETAIEVPEAAPGTTEPMVGKVKVSHPDRVLDDSTGVTKLDLVRYYEAISEYILPFLEDRPLALVRCVDQIGAKCFFQKKKHPGMAKSILAAKAGGNPVLHVGTEEGLLALVQFGVVELHAWGARLPRAAKPDWIVIDLDPDPSVPFSGVVRAAFEVREVFRTIGLESFVRTTGGKGLHVVAPIVPTHGWTAIKSLSHAIALTLEAKDPSRFVSTMSKRLRHGKIFVDYLRNGDGATAIVPYSARNRPGLTVSMPVSWKRLESIDPGVFTVKSVPAMLRRQRKDPWAKFFTLHQELPKNLKELLPET